MSIPTDFLTSLASVAVRNLGELLSTGVDDVFLQRVWDAYARATPDEAARRRELEALATADAAVVKQAVTRVVAAAGPQLDAQDRERLQQFLLQAHTISQRSIKGGIWDQPTHGPRQAEDLRPFTPVRFPRFKAGDKPLAGVDLELVELLGVGGFGEVWKARNAHLHELPPVALKFCMDPNVRVRLLRHEAKILAQVMKEGRHPGIVTLRSTYLNADPPCLECEYVPGGDMAGLVRSWHAAGHGTPENIARLILQLADTLRFTHRLSPPVVHRDLKPGNILVQADAQGQAQLRIADFGIGLLAGSEQGMVTGMGAMLKGAHTPLYGSPQQKTGAPPTPRDDIHAIGVIWYQALVNDFARPAPTGVRAKERLAERAVPTEQAELLLACVEPEEQDRIPDGAALAERLEQLLGRRHASPGPTQIPPSKPPEKSRSKVVLFGLAAVVAAVLGITVWLVTKKDDKPKDVETTVKEKAPEPITNTLRMKFVLVPPGKFVMGSEKAETGAQEDEVGHEVEITKGFYLGVYEVTQEEYIQVMQENPSFFALPGQGRDAVKQMDTRQFPVEDVSWEKAVEFCRKLSANPEEAAKGRKYRLPTEAEWEYACRGGSRGPRAPYNVGDKLTAKDANFGQQVANEVALTGKLAGRTCKVGSYAPNVLGLYDMHGNVAEWCQDWYSAEYYLVGPRLDPQGPLAGGFNSRVFRGGSWYNAAEKCRSAARGYIGRVVFDTTTIQRGFRVVMVEEKGK